MRTSPAVELARRLLAEGADLVAFDPQAGVTALEELPELQVAASALDAALGADCLVIATDWDEFRRLDLAALKEAMARPVIVDGRNLLDPDAVRDAGFWYYPTGRPAVLQGSSQAAPELVTEPAAVGDAHEVGGTWS